MTPAAPTTRPRPDKITLAGLGIVAVAAAGTSFDALAGLAGLAGWARDVRPALPIIVDTLAAVSTRAWLSGADASDAKRYAKRAALASIAVSMIGNTLFHLIASGWLHPSVTLVVGVAMVPPVGLAAAAHLVAVLRPAEQPVTDSHSFAEQSPLQEPAEVAQAGVVTAAPFPELVTVADTAPVKRTDNKSDNQRTPRRVDTAARVAKLATKHPDMKPAAMTPSSGCRTGPYGVT